MNLTGGSLEIRNRKWIIYLMSVLIQSCTHTHTHYPSLVMSQNREVILMFRSFVEKKI